ncbi:hypothetical protein O6P43_006813 [Quillaja saponaria]|uniref:Secreted protein n=1 Tax=Quillaja saponaria TaxID=32244 RepID=A0AAD7Q8Y5_QUISA|nr:hypothetical protein O6P43_006813 [Quillaja saponaria]
MFLIFLFSVLEFLCSCSKYVFDILGLLCNFVNCYIIIPEAGMLLANRALIHLYDLIIVLHSGCRSSTYTCYKQSWF